VYQEAFTNITRHAGATEVTSSVVVENDTITVIIEDNGKGFEAASNERKKSFGILGMKERVLAQGGSFKVVSATGKGTKLEIQLPYLHDKNI
jgi:signal transduction histidine kinase